MIHLFQKYYQFVWRYKLRFVVFIVSVVIANIFRSVQPYFYKLFIDNISQGNTSLIWWILASFILVRLIGVVTQTLSIWLGDRVLLPLARDIRMAVFEKIQDLDFAYHLSKSTGSLISMFKRGDLAVFNFFHSINLEILGIFVQFLVMTFFLSRLNIVYVGLTFATFAVNLLLAVLMIKRNISARVSFNQAEDQISSVIVDNMINYETVKLFANEDYELKRLRKTFVNWLQKLWGYANSFRAIDLSIGFTGNFGYAIVLAFAVWQLSQNQLSAGDLILILSFVANFYVRFFELTFKLRDLAKNQVDLEKYFEALDLKTKVKDPSKPQLLTQVKGEIHFEKVSFNYGKGKSALKNIDLRIRQGQSIALVGHSGVGKTTLVKLLMRLFDPTEGRITIDGVDIKNMTKSHLRSHLGVVPQDPILFNNTLKYNVLYGAQNHTDQELEAAIKMANLEEFVTSLPDGYDTQVGERGVKLSGGQKQRLSIARMILSNPQIIIFDEATSQLDSDSEKKIQEAFWKVSRDKTTLIVAHRLSTVVKADKIVVMENGQIKEIGSHRELLQKKGLYSHFWELQTID